MPQNGSVNKPEYHKRFVGDKRFKLSNHLGNVLAVVNDQKIISAKTKQFYDYFDKDLLWDPVGNVGQVAISDTEEVEIADASTGDGAKITELSIVNNGANPSFNVKAIAMILWQSYTILELEDGFRETVWRSKMLF